MAPRTTLLLLLCASTASAFDKNGVAPEAISLPSGPGSIQGLGESFQPQLNTGSGSTGIALAFPRGPGGITPELSLVYDSGAGNGAAGLGWSLSGMLSVRRNTDRGVPYYTDGPDGRDDDGDGAADNPDELDAFTGAHGEELVPLGDGSFRAENEAAFLRYTRAGAGWEARARNGRRYLFGATAPARIEADGKVFEWCLERVTDPNGNTIDYSYTTDPAAPAQKHLRKIRWGGATAYLAAVLTYEEGRPDVITSYRPGFELRTSVRLVGLDVVSHGLPAPATAVRGDLDGDPAGGPDALVRRYRFEYQPGSHLSLLTRVTQLGRDGITALPPATYSYGSWAPPDDVAAAVIRSRGAPTAGFDSPSVELIDMNGDGLPDLLSTAGSQHRIFLNRGVDAGGRLSWGPGQPVGNAPTIDIASDRTHLADATADGLSDLMVKVSNTSFLCYDNTSQNSWAGDPIPIRNTDTWPIWPYDGDGGRLSRSFDSDYSRSNDVLHTSATGRQLWLLLPSGRYAREMRLAPLVCEGKTFRFDLPGTQIADLNGDRLQDLAWIQATRVVYFPSRGRGDFAEPIIWPLGRTLSTSEIERSDFSDIDGDGLVDLTVVRPESVPNGVFYWLNRFDSGFDGPKTVRGLPAQRAGDALRWADMNGNGTTDIVISQAQSAPGEKVLVVDLVPEGKPFLLRRAENGIGRTIRMEYESSTAQMVRAEAAGSPWTIRMPVAVTVLSRIVEEDGLGPAYDRVLTYRDPYYDPVKQEFRGFSSADSREEGDASAPARVSRFAFDTGRIEPCLKGKQLAEEVLGDDGKLVERTVSQWRARVLADGLDGRRVCHAFIEASDRFHHEGETAGVRVRSETEYDAFGNAIAERRLGLDAPGDEIITEREFEIRLADWRLDLLARETVRDGAGTRLVERRFAHDANGNQVLAEAWLDRGDRFVALQRQRFDAAGNVIERTDATGGRRSLAYDALLSAWPVRETLHLAGGDLELSADYDLGIGVVTAAVGFTGERTEYTYDALGRLVETRGPGGAHESFERDLGAPVSRVTRRVREDDSGSTLDSHSFFDGHGREVLVKAEGDGGSWRVTTARAYNARKLESRTWLPYASATPDFEPPDPSKPHHQAFHDVSGRPAESVAPDGGRTRTVYRPLETLRFDAADIADGGSADLHRTDGLDRLVLVEERNGPETYRTRYAWNARGELESVTDALGNVKRFRFDSLGRLVEVDDPDAGRIALEYDDAGKLLERTGARGQSVAFTYDEAHRLVGKVHRGGGGGGGDMLDARQHHDEPAGELEFGDGTRGTARNTAGRIAWAEDQTGETHYSYDERGNVEWVLKRVRDLTTGLLVPFRTQRRYDLVNREVEIVFPDNDLLRFEHAASSFVASIRGDGAGSQTILASAERAASGRALRLVWGNGVESRCEYDASDRLVRDRVLGPGGAVLRDELITYDLLSNVTGVDDLRPAAEVPAASPRRTTARYEHDELHRLVRAVHGAAGSLGIIDHEYDALGNLIRQSTPPAGEAGHLADPAVALGVVAYEGGRSGRQGRRPGDPPGPHAVTATGSGLRLAYDASGNISSHGSARLGWDAEDRLVSWTAPGETAEYLHDHTGRRTIRRVIRRGAREEVWHIDAACEAREDGTLVKYAFLDGRRAARITGRLDQERDAIQSLRLAPGWNLVAAAVVTNLTLGQALGADAAAYESTGTASYRPVPLDTLLAPGKALWAHVPAARIVALRGRPRAMAGDVASPGPLHAWPRLEPFRPALDLVGGERIHVFDAALRRWRQRDPALPAFVSDAGEELGSAQAFWADGPALMRPRPASSGVVFYHADALGSIAVVTGAGGELVEERARHAFGALRHVHRPGGPFGATDHDFTGHERDRESGLIHMGARSYLDTAGAFASPDPRFLQAPVLAGGGDDDKEAFREYLSNPQMGNPYAYALRQPLKYVDPDGLQPQQVHQGRGLIVSESVKRIGDYRGAIRKFLDTKTGSKLVETIRINRGTVILREGPVRGDATSQLEYDSATRTAVVTIEFDKHLHNVRNHRYLDVREDVVGSVTRFVARDINWELRKVELSIKIDSFDDDITDLRVLEAPTTPRIIEHHKAVNYLYTPAADPQHAEFERDIGHKPW